MEETLYQDHRQCFSELTLNVYFGHRNSSLPRHVLPYDHFRFSKQNEFRIKQIESVTEEVN